MAANIITPMAGLVSGMTAPRESVGVTQPRNIRDLQQGEVLQAENLPSPSLRTVHLLSMIQKNQSNIREQARPKEMRRSSIYTA